MKIFHTRNEEEIYEYLNIDGKSQEAITPDVIQTAQKIEEEYDDEYRYALAWFFDNYPPIIADEDIEYAERNYSRYDLREEKRENGIVVFKIIEKESEEDEVLGELYDRIYEDKREEKLFD